MNKIAKRIVAGASAMILAFSSMAMTVSASSGSGSVNNVPVHYSTSMTTTSFLSTSYFGDDPTKYVFELQLGIKYQYTNQRNGDITTSELVTEKERAYGGGMGRQFKAPANCTMEGVLAYHNFWVNGVFGQYTSYAAR